MLILLLDHNIGVEYLNSESMVRFCEYECLDILFKLGVEFNIKHLNNSVLNNDKRVFFTIVKYVRPNEQTLDIAMYNFRYDITKYILKFKIVIGFRVLELISKDDKILSQVIRSTRLWCLII